MSTINNMTFNYQEYKNKTNWQKNKNCSIYDRSYCKIENNSDTDTNKILGNTIITMPSSNVKYELRAEYADDFSENIPFIKVGINNGDEEKEYCINIDDINARNASTVEIFALFSYADSHEKNMGFALSIWNTLMEYIQNNPLYVDMNQVEPLEKLCEQKSDWIAIVEKIRNEYIDNGLYKQVSDGNKLISLFEQYGKPETVNMEYMDAEHLIPASNCICQIPTDIVSACIEIDGNGELHYINIKDKSSNWSMKITQEQLKKALELGDEFALYVGDQSFWECYLNSNMNLTELRDNISKINQKLTYSDILDRLPESIRKSWENARIETGAYEFGIDEDGNRLYLSEFAKKYFFLSLQNKDVDFLGETVDSVLEFARECLEQLENSDCSQYTSDIQELKNSEKQFYQTLITYLES